MKLKPILFALLGVAAIFQSCEKEDDMHEHEDNEVTITIQEPSDGEVVADASDVHVHIDFEATEENHEIEVLLYPKGDESDKILDVDMHEHDAKIEFEQEVDLSGYAGGTEFVLYAQACVDHDCGEIESKEIEFSIP